MTEYKVFMTIMFILAGFLVGGLHLPLALMFGYVLAGLIEQELKHRFMNSIRKELEMKPLGRRERSRRVTT